MPECITREYYSEDITWCSKRNCNVRKCERNRQRIRPTSKHLSFADLEYTDFCPKKKADNITDRVASSMNKALGIHSPSRVVREMLRSSDVESDKNVE